MDLVALDIDGTLVDQDVMLTDRVRGAVRALVESGTHVVLATGRTVASTLPILDRLSLTTGYAVCSNGAVTIALDEDAERGYVVDDIVTFDPAPVLEVLRRKLPTALLAVETPDGGMRLTGLFPDGELMDEVEVVDFAELLRHPATRVVVRAPEQTTQEFLEVTADLGLHGVNYAVGWSAWLDLAPQGVSKASALDRVATKLSVAPHRTLAIGDGRNDLEMFAWAHRSVAMGQAPQEVREAAGELTGPVTADGVADVLEALYRNG